MLTRTDTVVECRSFGARTCAAHKAFLVKNLSRRSLKRDPTQGGLTASRRKAVYEPTMGKSVHLLLSVVKVD